MYTPVHPFDNIKVGFKGVITFTRACYPDEALSVKFKIISNYC